MCSLWVLVVILSMLKGTWGIQAGERIILEQFVYNYPGIHPWNLSTTNDPCFEWIGVGCTPDGYIASLDLSQRNLIGTFPEVFGQLLSLKTLKLNQNALIGSLPQTNPFLLGSLEGIDLSFNDFKGSVPSWISNLPDYVYLRKNAFDCFNYTDTALGDNDALLPFQNANGITVRTIDCLTTDVVCLHGGILTIQSTCNCEAALGFGGIFCQQNLNDCNPQPCFNGGTCVDKINDFECVCKPEFQGKTCESVIPFCLSNPCQNGARCVNGFGDFYCICPTGFIGKYCESNVNECEGVTCLNNGTCTDLSNSFVCECTPGFEGIFCEDAFDICARLPCFAGGICEEYITPGGLKNFTCDCHGTGFEGPICELEIDECASNPCMHGNCTDLFKGYTCNCTGTGFSGQRCEVNVPDCPSPELIPCLNGGTCVDLINDYSCDCMPGYAGGSCEINIDECASSPCLHQGACIDLINQHACDCRPGYPVISPNSSWAPSLLKGYFHGINCELPIDICFPGFCGDHGTCYISNEPVPVLRCHCLPGFSGSRCEITPPNLCWSSPCLNGGTCLDLQTGDYVCQCPSTFGGKRCEKELFACPQISHPCRFGTCFREQQGVPNQGCYCGGYNPHPPGYDGVLCQNDLNKCRNSAYFDPFNERLACSKHGSCIPPTPEEISRHGELYYRCVCDWGFTGKYCDIPVHPCIPVNPCQNGGVCQTLQQAQIILPQIWFDLKGDAFIFGDPVNVTYLHQLKTVVFPSLDSGMEPTMTCLCPPTKRGLLCEMEFDPCEINPCLNEGVCEVNPFDRTQAFCVCLPGTVGRRCEIQLSNCFPNPCLNGGVCTETEAIPFFSCACTLGYGGSLCDFTIYHVFGGFQLATLYFLKQQEDLLLRHQENLDRRLLALSQLSTMQTN